MADASKPKQAFHNDLHEHVFETRRHWINLVQRASVPGTLTLLFWLGELGPLYLVTEEGLARDWGMGLGLGLFVLSLFPAAWTAFVYYDWANDYLAIAADQIEQYEEHYIFSHRIQDIPLNEVQNVSFAITNPLYRRLNVGELHIETAGQEDSNITFGLIKDPQGVQNVIFELLGRSGPTKITEEPLPFLEYFFPTHPIPTPEGWLKCHRHPFILARRMVLPLLMNLAMLAPILWLVDVREESIILPKITIAAFLVLVWIGVVLWTLYVYEDWRNDYWLITDVHLVDVDALPLVSEKRRQTRLEDIQNVRVDVPSIWARFIHMGNVFAETAGLSRDFEMENIADPEFVQDEIFRRRAAATAWRTAGQAEPDEQQEFERRVLEIVSQRLGIQIPSEPPSDDE